MSDGTSAIWHWRDVSFIFLVLIAIAILVLLTPRPDIEANRTEWDNDPELQSRWIKRIDKVIKENGYVSTLSFENNVGLKLTSLVDNEQVNWALKLYLHQYEFEQDLILSEEYFVSCGEEANSTSISCCELRFRQNDMDRFEEE